MKTLVKVELVARKTIHVYVEHEADEAPVPFTSEERQKAIDYWFVGQDPEVEIDHVSYNDERTLP